MKKNLIYIYDEKEIHFKSFGVGVIAEAYNIVITKKMNDEHSLVFNCQKDIEVYSELRQNRFVKLFDKVFIIRTIEEYSTGNFVEILVRCEHILFELLDEFMPFMSRQKQTADTIVKYITNGTRFQSYSNIEGRFNLQVTRGSKLKCVDELCENVDGIRLCSDLPNEQGMFTVEVAPKRRRDLGVVVHNRKNRKKIKRVLNGNDVITRLFPYGQDGLTIEEAVLSGGKAYIDSENINDYLRPKESCVVFESVIEPNNLYELALEYLKLKKIPSVSYEIEIETLREYIEQADLIEIGDIITVIDEMIGDGIRTEAMITEITYYPDDKDKNMIVSLEQVVLGADKVIADMLNSQETDTGIRKGNVWTEFVTVPFSNETTTIDFGVAYQTKPVINVQIIGVQVVNASVSYITSIKDSVIYYTGCTIACPVGVGEFITMLAIGRV